ncbi:hypothetical protein O7631_00735 [Micromonospora sp. WMMD967]|nr:hypothetical protein [Micromonospora sp. WMMD967]MDG4835040.1 hypothetical protein [Micromonospora sp. WMMD967]
MAYGVFAVGEPIRWSVIVAVLAALLGVGYLVTAVLLRQRQRDHR